MKILVNTRLLIPGRLDGMGWFTYETLRRITLEHPDDEFFFLHDRPVPREILFNDNITPLYRGPQTRHPLLWYYWLEHRIPGLIRKVNPDLFLSPEGMISLKAGVRTLNVIHDLNFHHRPGDLPPMVRWYYNRFFPEYARASSRIATVSEYSAEDISRTYSIPRENIDVLYNGASVVYKPLTETEQDVFRREATGGIPYFLFVGNLHPRKNVEGLLQAYDVFREGQQEECRLVIVGRKTQHYTALNKTYKNMKYRHEILFRQQLLQPELRKYYASAVGLVYLPWFEGFGIPLLEAMACGSPIIAADTTSLPEVAGTAAMIVPSGNTQEAAAAMNRLYKDEKLQKSMKDKSLKRSEQFSWDRTARLLWESVTKTVE